jgi:hypothetical protein
MRAEVGRGRPDASGFRLRFSGRFGDFPEKRSKPRVYFHRPRSRFGFVFKRLRVLGRELVRRASVSSMAARSSVGRVRPSAICSVVNLADDDSDSAPQRARALADNETGTSASRRAMFQSDLCLTPPFEKYP